MSRARAEYPSRVFVFAEAAMRRKGSSSVRRQSLYAAIKREKALEDEGKRMQRTAQTREDAAPVPDIRDPIEVARAAGAALKGVG